jgi:hypothetical protein
MPPNANGKNNEGDEHPPEPPPATPDILEEGTKPEPPLASPEFIIKSLTDESSKKPAKPPTEVDSEDKS